jgi:hypothetical protein
MNGVIPWEQSVPKCSNCKNNNCCMLALTCIPYNYIYYKDN